MPSSLALRVARRLGRLAPGRVVGARPAALAWSGGVVSFTFDDFPQSALRVGGAILDKYRCRSTYYAALGLAGTESELGVLCGPDDIRAAYRQGHEIACHTFRHLDCSHTDAATVLADIAENEAALSALLDGFAPESFAYPYGGLSLAIKRLVAPRFSSCRGIARGFNRGTVDLADLRATKLYARDYHEAGLRDLIDRCRAADGWLIFYTHDIRETPSAYGCTPQQFAATVAYAAENAEILPVREVVARLGGLAGSSPSVPAQPHQSSAA